VLPDLEQAGMVLDLHSEGSAGSASIVALSMTGRVLAVGTYSLNLA
jgi:hypothetical protein